jgi:hypothetical protein
MVSLIDLQKYPLFVGDKSAFKKKIGFEDRRNLFINFQSVEF